MGNFPNSISSGVSLMCIFSGLFGISTILFSLNDNSTIPHQNSFYELNIDFNKFKSIFAGGITGAILGFLPGFGPAQGTVIAQAASGTNDNSEDDTVNFLLATSGLNISDCLFFFNGNLYNWKSQKRHSSLYVLFNLRYVNQPFSDFYFCIFNSSFNISDFMFKIRGLFSKLMGGVDYRKLSIAVIILQIGILYIFTLYYKAPIFYMTLALITSTALGMLPHYIGVGKSHLMGVLIVPAIVIYMQMFI